MQVLIVRNNANPQAIDASLLLAAYLATQQLGYVLVDSSDLGRNASSEEVEAALAAGVDLAVALGGDGTILRTAHQVGTSGVPILGINFGRLGFLANSSDEGVVAVAAAALAGDVVAERRTNLRIDVVCEGEADPFEDDEADAGCGAGRAFEEGDGVEGGSARGGAFGAAQAAPTAPAAAQAAPNAPAASPAPTAPRSFFALNEVAVTRGAFGRIVDFSLDISGAHIADMRGDGLVVATATGSTAYALSAGGPLVAPGFGGLVTVPLAPHTLHSRAIVTAENDVVEMGLAPTAADREAAVFVDGELLEARPPREARLRAPWRSPHRAAAAQVRKLLRTRRKGVLLISGHIVAPKMRLRNRGAFSGR